MEVREDSLGPDPINGVVFAEFFASTRERLPFDRPMTAFFVSFRVNQDFGT
jgi:hypothetical protein